MTDYQYVSTCKCVTADVEQGRDSARRPDTRWSTSTDALDSAMKDHVLTVNEQLNFRDRNNHVPMSFTVIYSHLLS